MKRSYDLPDVEPETKKFELPSAGQHVLQVTDILDNPDPDIVVLKIEVAQGCEMGRTLLHRVGLDDTWKGFFLTRLFLKAIGEPYKSKIEIDTDMWFGKQFVANIVHNEGKNGKTYANIDEFLFDVVIPEPVKDPKDLEWEE